MVLVSRETALIANFLHFKTIVVLIGTFYPIALEMTSGMKITVGPPFFEATNPITGLLVANYGRWSFHDLETRLDAKTKQIWTLELTAALTTFL